jgi:hypothetical protein
MKKSEINCQSCGMPLNRDKKIIGTEIDGSLSEMYCSHCYQNGKFTMPDITVDEMRARVTEKIIEMKLPRFVAKFLTRNTCKLKRWKKIKPQVPPVVKKPKK